MSIIQITGIDPSFTSFAYANAKLDLEDMSLTPFKIGVVETSKNHERGSLVSADIVRRCRNIYKEIKHNTRDSAIIIAEIPSGGGKNSNAIKGMAYATAIVACLDKRLVQVSPRQVKMVNSANPNEDKEEMVRWATDLYPYLDWPKGRKYFDRYAKKCDDIADALAAIHAGIETENFLDALEIKLPF